MFAPKYEANADASGYVPGAGCGFRARVWGEGDGVCEGKRERGVSKGSCRERSGALRYRFCMF